MDYSEWNELIINRFFTEDARGSKVLLQVDPEELAAMADMELPGDARADFQTAISPLVGHDESLALFERHIRFKGWDIFPGAKNPPFVALLAASVLAAHDMSPDSAAGISSANYYERLRAVIGVHLNTTGRARLTGWWRRLNKWLDGDLSGARGASSAFPFQGYPNIGYPLSQCTLRRDDRNKLPDFFRWCQLGPGELIDEQQLFEDFQQWVALARCTFSGRTRALLGVLFDEGQAEAVSHDLAYEYRRWDGSIRERGGRRSALIDLQCKFIYPHRRVSLQFLPRCPLGFPHGMFSFSEAGRVQPIQVGSGDSGFYEPLALPVTSGRLREGISLSQGIYRLDFHGRAALVFEQDSDLGDWVTRDQTSVGEPSVVLCHASLAQTIQETLRQQAATGWHALPDRENGLPPDWRGYCCVEFAHAFEAEPGAEVLEPRRRFGVTLEGGLKFAADCWLSGALPSVAVQSDMFAELPVTLDGRLLATVRIPARLDLNEHGLEAGVHELRVGGRVVRFRAVEAAPPDLPTKPILLGWPVEESALIIASTAGAVDTAEPALLGAFFTDAAVKAVSERHVALYPGGGDVAWLGSTAGQYQRAPQRQLVRGLGQAVIDLRLPADFVPCWLWWREGTKQFIAAVHSHPPRSPVVEESDDEPIRTETWARMLVNAHLSDLECTERCRGSCSERLLAYRKVAADLLR